MKTILIGFFILLLNYENTYSQCDVVIIGLESEYCIVDNSVTLEGYPLGGTFSGPGITGKVFNPTTAGAGTHEIKYVFDSVFYNINIDGIYNPIDGVGQSVTLSDDQVSAFIPLSFTFNFFGTDYTQVRLSSNGFLTFNNSTNSGCCEGDPIPSTSDPDNIIAFAWSDLNPNEGGSFQYFTIGTAPNRIFVVDVKNLSHYGFPGRVTSQIQLHETTNIIEIHTTEMGYGGDVHTMGVENVNGTLGYAVEGRNATIWSTEEEMVQFVPEYCKDSITVNVTVNDDPAAIGLSVNEIDYGEVESGAIFTQELTLTNIGCNTLTIDSLRNDSLAFSYIFSDNQILTPGNSVTVEIQLQSTSLGTITDSLNVYTDIADTLVILTATIVSSPVMSVDQDTLEVSINACSGSESATFNILNSADGQLNYTVTQYEQFLEDFEDGNYNDWSSDHDFAKVEVQNTEIAIGDYALKLSGIDGNGMMLNIDPRQATYISFWIKPDMYSWSGCGIAFGDDNNGNSNSGLINQVFYVDDGYRYFYDKINNYYYTVLEDKWYHLECKNIDFVNGNYDWYIDGQLVQEDISFGSGDKYISTIRIFSDYASEFYIDNIYIGDEADWLTITPQAGSLTNGSSDQIQVTMSADGLESGTYEKYVFINGNDPANLTDTVLCILTVDGTPQAQLSMSAIDFGDVFLGDSLEQSVTLTNTGCDTLFVLSVTMQEETDEFNFVSHTDTIILPGEKYEGTVKFKADTVGGYSNVISVVSNAATQNINISGNCITSPEITLSTDTLTYSISCTGESSQSFTISNANASDLNFQIEINDVDLEDVLTNLNTNYQSIIDLVPNRFDIDYGDNDTYIEAGGDYMYYGGNYLSTNLGGDLVYSDNTIVSSPLLGDEGEYFVRKYEGLFVFAGKLDDISTFTISGSLGNWGAEVDGTVLEYEYNGITYYGFVKRVYGLNSPSVNHLFITRNPDVVQNYSTNYSNDNHELSNLEKSSELFYLLYAGTYGAYIDDEATLAIMQRFVQSITPFAPEYVTSDIASGTVNAGSQVVNIALSGADFNTGTHYRELTIASNDPLNQFELLTLEINVTGNPELYTEMSALDFGKVAVADSLTKELTIYNTGCDTLFITNITSSITQYNVDATVLEILPDDSYTVLVEFKPESVQAYPADLTIESDAGNSTLDLTGSGVTSGPQIETDSTTFTMTLECENEKSGVFTISNSGEADLVVAITDNLTDLILSESEATILAGESLEVEVTFMGEESLANTYNGSITITSNDAVTPVKDITVSITDSYNKVVTIDIDWEEDDICQGEEIIVDAGYGFTSYSWSSGDDTKIITVNSTGKYVATVQDYNGCESKDSVTVNVHNPVVDLGADIDLCQGDSSNLDAGTGFVSYIWNTTDEAQTISVDTSGTYAVIITDAYSCTASDTIVVTVHDLPVVDLGADITITNEETATLDAGSGIESYLWSEGSTTQTLGVDGSSAGIGTHEYSVEVTDVNGCKNSDTISVIVIASTGIDLVEGSDILSAYPNPVKDNLYIQFNTEIGNSVIIKLCDLTGGVKYIEEVQEISSDGLHEIKLSELPSGMYLLKVNNDELSYVKQIIVE